MTKRTIIIVTFILAAITIASGCNGETETKAEKLKPQTTCPAMKGGEIDKSLYVDHNGMRIYACGAECVDKIKADPEKYIALLKEKGQKPESLPAICGKCGEIKGSDKCCKPDATRCDACGLTKGSPGCCKDLKPKPGETDVYLCPKCGEVLGSEKCCDPDAARCDKCGLAKGSPGCCNLPK